MDEQSNPLLKGMLVRNGGSFEDDLSLGAEGGTVCFVDSNGMLAKEKRLQFHQKGRSMNSTGSGKSSATVSSVSELLELYEEDPEEVLYNLGFGRDEPDIASKIPARFFNSSSFARGIDIKVFLNAQMQRMEVENPNFALTSRFRQIEVLTTVANAFSSLYSQVSGTPLQKIGSMNSVSSSKEASSPPPLNRSNTASRLMKTLSKLNLCGAQQADSSGCSTPSPVEKGKGPAETESEENDAKNDSKLPKFSKKKDSPSFLATVKEEIASSQSNATDTHRLEIVPAGTDDKHENTVSAADVQNSRLVSPQDRQCEESGLLDPSSLSSSPNAPNNTTSESGAPAQRPPVASVGREPCMPLANPSVMNLMLQQKDSFEMEEIQSTEGDLPHVPASHQLAVTKSRKADQLLRTASQHSDSSGFAEDSSTDCSPFNQLQVSLPYCGWHCIDYHAFLVGESEYTWTLCGPPSFTYKYTHMEEDEKLTSEDDKQEDKEATSQPVCKSTLFIATSSSKREVPQAGPRRLSEAPSPTRGQSCPLHTPAHMSQSTCSLHSLPAEWLDRPLCEHMRTLSTHSVPSISGSSLSALLSPFSCPFSPRHSGYSHRPHAISPPSTVEMQLRRVLHDIRNSLQNLSQYPVMRGQDFSAATGYTTQRSSILPLYENTFQELQVVRRNLNLFRTQMMDLELAMLRQQTTVYQHMTEEERYEADQLQSLRKSVRMELQELEMQLEERLLALEDQLRSLHMSSPYRPQTHIGMYGSRSADNLSCPSPLNVIEPVSELMREQSFLKSELGLGLGDIGLENLPAEGTESVFSHGNSDSSSVCSTASRKAGVGSSELTGKSKSQSKKLYRASVALTPTPPVRAGTGQQVESSEEFADSKPEMEHKLERVPLVPSFDEIHRSVEQEELQQVIREIKESIVGEIRREIVSGLLAAVSPQSRSTTAKQDAQL
uniref:ITPR interacting domain containing 2 n=1 Tax=Chrysolophus pictus TaxID=9089 RepID=A0A8C3LXD7_CHRPC